MKSKLICANPIIDTSPPGGRQIHNETPFAWLALFRIDTKTTDLEVGEGGGGKLKGPDTLPKETSFAK